MREKRKKPRKIERKKDKTEIFTFDFSTLKRVNGTLGVYLTIEGLRVFVY